MAKKISSLEEFGILVSKKINSFHTHDHYFEEFKDELLRDMRKFVAEDKKRKHSQNVWQDTWKAKKAAAASSASSDDDVWL